MGLFWRIVLAIILFAVVVLVSYIKSDLSAARIDTNPVAAQENQTGDPAVDSIRVIVEEPESQSGTTIADTTPGESLTSSTNDLQDTTADSLPAVEIEPEEMVTPPVQSKQSAPPKAAQVDSAKLVIEYFQKRMASLPDDLTSYERRVAIKELRDETCEKFKITPAEFNEFAREKNLAYP